MDLVDSEAHALLKMQDQSKEKTAIVREKLHPTVYIIFFSLILDLIGFTIILPLFPSLLEYYDVHDKVGLYPWLVRQVHFFQKLFGVPSEFNKVLFGGLLGSLFSLLQFLASPILGAMSDIYGRKPVLLLSMGGIAVSYAIWAFSENFALFVLARLVGGISKGNISLSAAVVTDVSSPSSRGKGMALVGIAFSVGFIVGPLIGAAFAAWSHHQEGQFFVVPALFALTLAIFDIGFLAVCFQESLPVDKRARSVGLGFSNAYGYISPSSLFTFSPVQKINRKDLTVLQQIGLIYFIYLFLYSGLEYTLTFLTHMRFHYTSMQQGKLYFISGITMVLVQGGYVRRIPPGKEEKTAYMGLFLIIPSFIVIGLAPNPPILILGLLLYSFASATVVPCLTTVVSRLGSDEQKGTVLGIFRSLGALARGLGPLAAAMSYWSMGATSCYCLGGLLLLAPFILMRRLLNPSTTHFTDLPDPTKHD